MERDPGLAIDKIIDEKQPERFYAFCSQDYTHVVKMTRLWKTLAKPLADLGVLKETDLTALEMLCVHYGVVRESVRDLEKDGLTTEGMYGSVKKHPSASVFVENSRMLKAYLTEFGLTPSSRVRIKADPEETKTLAQILMKM